MLSWGVQGDGTSPREVLRNVGKQMSCAVRDGFDHDGFGAPVRLFCFVFCFVGGT